MKSFKFVIIVLLSIEVGAQTPTLSIADSLYALGDYTKAINSYAKMGTPKAHLQIARAYNAIENYDKSIIQYENVIGRDSSLQIAKFELGKLFLKINDPKNAAYVFLDLISKGNRNAEYYYYMGNALKDLKSKMFIQYYRSAVELDSTHLRSIFQLGKYYVAEQENDSVLKFVDKGLQFYENDVALINLKALAHFNNEEYKMAQPLFERLLELGEHEEHIYNKLGYCYYENRELGKAKDAYNSLLEYDGAKADAYNGLGNTYWRAKDLDSAAIFYKKAIAEKKPYLGHEYNALARLAREQDNLKTALQYYKKAYEEDPANFFIYYQICAMVDQVYDDPKMKLEYYKTFIEKFGKDKAYLSDIAEKRISDLKEELHFSKD